MQHKQVSTVSGQAKQRVKECTVAWCAGPIDAGRTIHFIDVREDHEFWIDHAAGARHLGKGIIERDIENVIPDKQAPLCCIVEVGIVQFWLRMIATDGLYQCGINEWWY